MNKNATPCPLSMRDSARARIQLLQNLLRSHDGDINGVVHDARRELKKLRSMLRLIRQEIGEECYGRENASLRDTGRLLGPLRDAWVELTLVENLARRRNGAALRRTFDVARQHLRASYEEVIRAHSPERVFSEASKTLEPACHGVEGWPDLTADFFATFGKEFQGTYQRGQSRFLGALRNPTVANLHEWRKLCKDLRYQLELAGSSDRNPFGGIITPLHKLTDSLGKHHDLAVLRETLETLDLRNLSQRQSLSLHKSTESQQRAALDAGVALGCRIFSARPKEFAKRLESAWKRG